MKILQIFGVVVAVHLLAFLLIFASPGCSSGPRSMPTPDATVPVASTAPAEPLPAYNTAAVNPQPVDLSTPAPAYQPISLAGHATPTRPGSAAAVAVTPPKPVENVAPVSTYTVGRGDSLWSIAKKNGLTVSELAKANSLTTGTILKPGRKLIIPGQPAAKEPAAVPPAGMSLPAEKTAMPAHAGNGEIVKHTVQVGESLGTIARKYQVSAGELAAANNITDPSKIRAGQQLVIPGGKAAAAKASAPAPKAAAARTPATKPPAETAAKSAETAPADKNGVQHFDLTPPPPGQDLDAGLKSAETEVPTIKVEEAKPAAPAKN